MTTQNDIYYFLFDLLLLDLFVPLESYPNLCIIFSVLSSLPKFSYLFLMCISSVVDFIYLLGFSHHICLSHIYLSTTSTSCPSAFSLSLPLSQSALKVCYELSLQTFPKSSYLFLSVLSSAFHVAFCIP